MDKKLWKSALCIVMVAVMCFSSVIGVYALDSAAKYADTSGTYDFTKYSHPASPIKAADGIVDYAGNGVLSARDQGQGDRAQNYAWSAIGYGDWVYVGTCYNAMGNTLTLMDSALGENFDQETMTATLNVLFNGTFYSGEEDGGNPGGCLVKVNVKTGEVKLLMSRSTTGDSPLFRNACEYQGMLYFCGSVNGLPCIYQINPKTDECKMVYQGMTREDYIAGYLAHVCTGIRGMCEFNGQLIVSCVTKDGPLILSSTHPWDGADAFTQIADQAALFNYPAYHYEDSIYGGSIWETVVFNDALYVSICTGTPDNMPDDNTMQSFALVRGDQAADGSWKWTSVIGDKEKDGARYTFGIDPERTRSGAGVLQVYNGYLYIGEYNDEEIALERVLFDLDFNFVNANLKQSVNLYRMDKNENIELIVGDRTRMFPKGGSSGLGSGFGRNENQYIWRMTEYGGKLYVGTFDTSSLLEPVGQFTNGDLLHMTRDEWASLLGFIRTLLQLTRNKGDDATPMSAAESESITTLEPLFDAYTDEELAELMVQTAAASGAEAMAAEDEDEIEPTTGLSLRKVMQIAKGITTCGYYMSRATRGFDLYTTEDGIHFETITRNGFGDPYNHGLRTFATTSSCLSIGTANPFYGAQLWSMDLPHVCPGAGYSDMPAYDNWAHAGLDYCIANNLLYGMTSTTIVPDGTTTRAQLVTILWRQAGCPEPEGASAFKDLTQDWYRKAVAWAAETGVVAGTSATTFNPDGAVTRQDMTAILYRYTRNVLRLDVSRSTNLSAFPDCDQVASYARPAMAWACAEGLISGVASDGINYLQPQGSATRAQVATILTNFCNRIAS